MHRTVILICLTFAASPAAFCETQPLVRVQPVCGNTENGIVVGKPRIYDDRMLELLIRSLEWQRTSAAAKEIAQLTEQIASLRSLSARALSDRVLVRDRGASAVPRAQALVGFQISLDPTDKYTNAVAEVEVTLSTKSEPRQPAALITILPKDSSGEIAPLEKAATAREPMKICSTGFRESDRDLTFAWQFRPPSASDRVQTGIRQVYAMLALPTASTDEYLADLHIHSQWRALKKIKRRGNLDFREESVRDELWAEAIRYNPAEMELTLRPRINAVRFVLSDGKDALVIAVGENFLPDTEVSLGTLTFPPSALHIERERHLQFAAPVLTLMRVDPYLTGRYGSPLLLVDPKAISEQWTSDPSWGLKIDHARARPKDYEQSELRIKLKSRQHKKPLDEMIVNSTLVSVAGKLLPVTSIETDPTDSDASLIHFDLPTAALRAAPKLVVARLLGGELFRDSADVVLEDDITASRVSVLASTEDEVMLGIGGTGFSNLVFVQIAGATYTRWTQPGIVVNGSNMITLRLKRSLLDGVRQLTVGQGFAQPMVLPIPGDLSPAQPTTHTQPKRDKRR